ncbi:mediator of RNA polymerase II transcription subunit 33A-like [Juglans microcarpa x Juglans regia]|uniref:mediator of RNA polymerase II transcription subunit 33A-like n=1 Tax=Juglans microcarpa x Juglans regia TaxID=2249226 RepID=UPI001B7E834D|nr:mediator of RNA polymerase II transcription subunit 33A-like [Juglans microcarpa x Juglans regia]
MADSPQRSVWDSVIVLTREAQEKGSDPLLWAMQLSSYLNSAEASVSLPSVELSDVLVSYICWDNNVPIMWKFLDKALVLNIVPPMLVLALLSIRVIPSRRFQPAAYRLFMELLKKHAFTSLKSQLHATNYQRVMQSIDNVLRLSQIFGLQTSEAGAIVVEFIFSIVWQLLDASLDDEGLLELTSEKKFKWEDTPQDMEVGAHDSNDEKQTEHLERVQKFNTVMAIELIGQFLKNKVTSEILYLARQNMSAHWEGFTQRFLLLGANSSALRNTKVITPEELLKLTSNTQMASLDCKLKSRRKFHDTLTMGPLPSSAGLCNEACRSALWLPLDFFLEDAVETTDLITRSAIESITVLVKVSRATNYTTWHDTFLGLWIAALRVVQRDRDPIEAPRPRLDPRLCLLLSITTLVVADLIEEDESALRDETQYGSSNQWKEKRVPGKCRHGLVSSLQMLGDFQGLLIPPQSTVYAANQAAAKAMFFISGVDVGNANSECVLMKDMPTNCSGNMRHLIVEACIARNLLDTSAYFWPGYVNGNISEKPRGLSSEVPGWTSFMQGASLTQVMISALVSSPASRLEELEKIFEIAVNGSNEEKISVAMILCGASLIWGWNIQEHTAAFIIKLLTPPAPADYSGSDSHLIGYAPLLNVLIVGISSFDRLQIFSQHGLVPQLACSLMTICEVFGSCVPDVVWPAVKGKRITAHDVFSNAFILFLRLWRFNRPPIEHRAGDTYPVQSPLTPDYLLLIRNSHLGSPENVHWVQSKRRLSAVANSATADPIFLKSFPKLEVWFLQHHACIVSTLSELVQGTPVHQIVDKLLKIMFRNTYEGSQSRNSVTSESSGFSGPKNEDTFPRLNDPAWNILEAIPFVAEASLKACSHGKISPRELATGLRILCDCLPASLASITSYLSAEVTRGVWKSVSMNGTDWPSPDANLSNFVEGMKKIVAFAGLDVPSVTSAGSSTSTLPLPLAALVTLTLTYKVGDHHLLLAGPALESLSSGCPWPCMPIVASLWTQKAKRWHDFFVIRASRTVILQNPNYVVKLLESCFTATLVLNASSVSSEGGVGVLLGDGINPQFCGWSPWIIFLLVRQEIRETILITEKIVSLLMHSVKTIAFSGLPRERLEKLKTTKNTMRSGQVSLAAALTRVKLVASVGASLSWLCGGIGLIQSLFREVLPSWFVSAHSSELEGRSEGMIEILRGSALAYLAFTCGAFVWGIDSTSMVPNWRRRILGSHMEFIARALDGKMSLGCDRATWRAYVLQFLSLMMNSAPTWVLETDVDVLKRLSRGLMQWNEGELALALLGIGGFATMGAVAELIIEKES